MTVQLLCECKIFKALDITGTGSDLIAPDKRAASSAQLRVRAHRAFPALTCSGKQMRMVG